MDRIPTELLKNNFLAFKGIGSNYLFQAKTFNIYRIDEAVLRLFRRAEYENQPIEPQDFPEEIRLLLLRDSGIKTGKKTLDKLRAGYMQPPGSLTNLNIYLSSGCNLRCRYCYTDRTLQGTIDTSTAFSAVDYYLERLEGTEKPASINFFGGEPLLHFRIIKEITEYVKKHRNLEGRPIGFYMTTNGTLLTSRIIDYMKENNFELVISVDGGREAHDRNRRTQDGNGTYDEIRKNILLIPKDYHHRVRLRATITPEQTDLQTLQDQLRETGIARNGFEMMYETSDEEALKWDEKKTQSYDTGFKKYIESIYNRIKAGCLSDEGLNFISDELRRIKYRAYRNSACQMGRESITIAPDGYFYPCHWLISYPEWRIGTPEEGLDPDVNRSYPRLVFDIPKCSECWTRFLCGGGCPAVSYSSNRNITAPENTVCKDRKIRWSGIISLYAELLSTNDPILDVL